MKNIIKSLIDYFVQNKEIVSEKDNLWEEKIGDFYKTIGYRFQNQDLLKAALTHNSYLKRNMQEDTISPFERMEFLGDSILGLVVAEHLFTLFPNKKEGNLSKMKSKIVSEKYLAIKAKVLNLGEFILLSDEEIRSGGKNRKSITSDAMESLICALYLDGGMGVARKFIHSKILKGFEKEIKNESLINFKSKLQEHTQSLYQKPPTYVTVKEEGPDHLKTFHIEVFINDELIGIGNGKNKKEAQQNAAKNACKKLKI